MNDDEEFNKTLRKLIILFLAFSSLFILSLVLLLNILKLIIRLVQTPETSENINVIRNGRSLVLWLSSLALSMSIASWFLVPFTILFKAVILRFNADNSIEWLDEGLIQSYWDWVFVGSNVSLFFLLPLAYFYSEAEDGTLVFLYGFWFNKKIREACIVWLLVAISVLMLSQVIKSIMGFHEANFLIVLNGFCVIASSLMRLFTYPIGVSTVNTYILEMPILPSSRKEAQEEFELLEIEEKTIKTKIERTNGLEAGDFTTRISWQSISSTGFNENVHQRIIAQAKSSNEREEQKYLKELAVISKKKSRIRKFLKKSVYVNNSIFLVTYAVHFFCSFFIAVLLVFNNVKHVFGYLNVLENNITFYFPSVLGAVMFVKESLTMFHLFLEVCLSFYFESMCLIGMVKESSLSFFAVLRRSTRSKVQEVSIPSILAASALILIESSTNPIILRLVSLTDSELYGYYGMYSLQNNASLLKYLYQILLLLIMCLSSMQIGSFSTIIKNRGLF